MEKITQEELDKILRLHKLWIYDELEGEKADLNGLDLSGLDLIGADLKYADLSYANLRCANLIGVNLRYTDLNNANLTDADLTDTDLGYADLTNANLFGANLSCADLTNADLTNTKGLPSQEETLDKLFEKVEEGYIVYKAFELMYKPPKYWDIKEGSIIEEEVDMDRRNDCSYGINVATKEWIENDEVYDNQPIWRCLIRFKDLNKVCVPYGTDGKVRCGRLKLLEIVG